MGSSVEGCGGVKYGNTVIHSNKPNVPFFLLSAGAPHQLLRSPSTPRPLARLSTSTQYVKPQVINNSLPPLSTPHIFLLTPDERIFLEETSSPSYSKLYVQFPIPKSLALQFTSPLLPPSSLIVRGYLALPLNPAIDTAVI